MYSVMIMTRLSKLIEWCDEMMIRPIFTICVFPLYRPHELYYRACICVLKKQVRGADVIGGIVDHVSQSQGVGR